jgi:hypothetical protein
MHDCIRNSRVANEEDPRFGGLNPYDEGHGKSVASRLQVEHEESN